MYGPPDEAGRSRLLADGSSSSVAFSSMIAFLTDQTSIRRILDHLGLSSPPQDKPQAAAEGNPYGS
jgi:hypothetical protein